MDDDSLRNWGYYELPLNGHLGLQLVTSIVDRDTKPFLSTRDNPVMVSSNGGYHPRDCMVTEPPVTQIDYVRDSWINHREKFMHMFPGNQHSPVLAEALEAYPLMPMVQQHGPGKETRAMVEEPLIKKEDSPFKKQASPATPKSTLKAKKPRKGLAPKERNLSSQRAKTSKRNVEVIINGVDMDITGIPIPICSCTGTPQQCYRWGCGGWQSACCTMTISMHPLPMSTKRRGARIAGRKMSQGAFKKVLEKLATDGYDFSNPIDLRSYWAKHGTNKFVVIR